MSNQHTQLIDRPTSRLTRFSFWLMILGSISIALHAAGFQFRLSGDPSFHIRFDEMSLAGTMHVVGGGIVLLLGGFQFSTWLRTHYLTAHRWMGRIYLCLVGVAGTGGLMLAPFSAGGLVAHWGFGILAVIWLFSAWQAYASIRAGDVAAHRAWMMRNFAMTFGAVTLRIYLGILLATGTSFEDAYPTVAWISWVPNLILIEWYLALSSATAVRQRLRPAQSTAAFGT